MAITDSQGLRLPSLGLPRFSSVRHCATTTVELLGCQGEKVSTFTGLKAQSDLAAFWTPR
jgi:hypothetical protein